MRCFYQLNRFVFYSTCLKHLPTKTQNFSIPIRQWSSQQLLLTMKTFSMIKAIKLGEVTHCHYMHAFCIPKHDNQHPNGLEDFISRPNIQFRVQFALDFIWMPLVDLSEIKTIDTKLKYQKRCITFVFVSSSFLFLHQIESS